MIFKTIWIIFLIPFVFIGAFFLKARRRSGSLRFSSGELFQHVGVSLKVVLSRNILYLRALIIALCLCALSRPQIPLDEVKIETEGIDIVLAVDASGSMLAEDFTINGTQRNRLYVVKEVIKDFVAKRHSDRIGLIAFAARAYTVCPLTLDYDWLLKNLERVEIGAIEDGTAVGSAINSSLNRLKDTSAKSKMIVLLTDGRNNAGNIEPATSAEAAKALGVKIYTIGAGSKGLVPFPATDIFGRRGYRRVQIDIDETMLQAIAQKTEGKYFRATDTASLKNIYTEIDALEKVRIEETGFRQYKELFSFFLVPAFLLLIVEGLLSHTILRRLP